MVSVDGLGGVWLNDVAVLLAVGLALFALLGATHVWGLEPAGEPVASANKRVPNRRYLDALACDALTSAVAQVSAPRRRTTVARRGTTRQPAASARLTSRRALAA